MKTINWNEQQVEENLLRLKHLRGNSELLDAALSDSYTLTVEEQKLFPFFHGHFKPIKNAFTNPKFLADHNQRVDGLVNLLNQIDCWTETDETKPYRTIMGIIPTSPYNEANIEQVYRNTLGTGLKASNFYEENVRDHFHFQRRYKFPGPLLIVGGLGLSSLLLGEKYNSPVVSFLGIASLISGLIVSLPIGLIPPDSYAIREKVRRSDIFISEYRERLR